MFAPQENIMGWSWHNRTSWFAVLSLPLSDQDQTGNVFFVKWRNLQTVSSQESRCTKRSNWCAFGVWRKNSHFKGLLPPIVIDERPNHDKLLPSKSILIFGSFRPDDSSRWRTPWMALCHFAQKRGKGTASSISDKTVHSKHSSSSDQQEWPKQTGQFDVEVHEFCNV